MGADSKIEWTHHTFNPWWGCARVSPGCQHCYAEALAKRYGHDVWGKSSDRRFFGEKHWNEPLRWNAKAEQEGVRRRVFCASMADVFEDREDLIEERLRLWSLIEATPALDWLLLTKRPENVVGLLSPIRWDRDGWPDNVWLGVTVEDQERADERIPLLLQIPARVRFLSCEPLLGPVELRDEWLVPRAIVCGDRPAGPESASAINAVLRAAGERLGGGYVDWVIAGGESGPGARPMDPAWARSLRNQCTAAGVPYLFKQWGAWLPYEFSHQPPFWDGQDGDFIDGHHLPAHLSDGDPMGSWWWPDPLSDVIYRRAGKKAAGRLLDGRTWDEVPTP